MKTFNSVLFTVGWVILISVALFTTSCSLIGPREVVVQTEYVERVIPIQTRPVSYTHLTLPTILLV